MEESAPAPKITALILSYNAAPAMRGCLAALENSSGRDQLEILVVDCGSRDESSALDNEFAGITIMRLPRNFGATKALNIGMRTAKADYVLVLAPEVVVEPNTAMELAARLDADESLVAVCPTLVDETGHPRKQLRQMPSRDQLTVLWREPDSLPYIQNDAAGEANIPYSDLKAIAVRKSFVKAINWFDERYGEFGADLELAFQIRRSQKKVLLLPGVRATVASLEPTPLNAGARATLSADRAHGVAVFVGKHYGWFAGILFRIQAVFSVLGKLLLFQQPAFQFRRLTALLTGQKVDGSQSTV